MSRQGRLAALAALAFAAFAIAGCGKAVDDVKTEELIEENIERSVGKKVSAVDCPSGVEIEVGARFQCAVSLADGEEETATMKILSEEADLELADLKPAK